MQDRLKELHTLARSKPISNPYLDPALGPDDEDETSNLPGFLEEFFVEMEHIRHDIDSMERSIVNLKEAYAERLDQVDTKSRKKKTNFDADALADGVNRTQRNVRGRLEDIGKKLPKGSVNLTTEERIARNVHTALLNKFMEVMHEFQNVQGSYNDKSRNLIKSQVQLVNPNASDDDIQKAIENGPDQIFSTSERAKVAAEALTYIQDRHKEILKLQKSLEEVHQMFLDLAALVEQQGEVIDRIAFNISHAKEDVLKATEELKQANKQSRRACLVM